MADIPTIARQRALNCEAKKHAYRQTQDGVVVSFVLHPQEVPDDLATAPLGTRYVLAMVELNDDETPVERSSTVERPAVNREVAGSNPAAPAKSEDSTTPARARKSWHEMSPATQAGILCNDMSFQKFLSESYEERWRGFAMEVSPDDRAAAIVRTICGVQSRAEISGFANAEGRWINLVHNYRKWQIEPSVVPA